MQRLNGNLGQAYIKSLIEVMIIAEERENLENLHALCSLMQTIRKWSNLQAVAGTLIFGK